MNHSFEDLLHRKFMGWKPEDFIFISLMGDVGLMDNFNTMDRREDYTGINGMHIVLVGLKSNILDMAKQTEKLIAAGVETLGAWIVGEPTVREIVFYGKRSPVTGTILLEPEWAEMVKQLHQAASRDS